jgi:hypothetical protein
MAKGTAVEPRVGMRTIRGRLLCRLLEGLPGWRLTEVFVASESGINQTGAARCNARQHTNLLAAGEATIQDLVNLV